MRNQVVVHGQAVTLPESVQEAYPVLCVVAQQLKEEGRPEAAFVDAYAVITRRVAEEVSGQSTSFAEPAVMSRLAGRFCALFVTALARRHEPHENVPAWTVAFEASQLQLTPLHHVMLGLNAHINYDLAVGLSDILRDHPEKLARFKQDHDEVNVVLTAAAFEILDMLADRYDCPVSRKITSLPSRTVRAFVDVGMMPIRSWRERVWLDCMHLLQQPMQRAGLYRQMSERAYRYALGILMTRPLATR